MKASSGDWKDLKRIDQQLLEALKQKQFVEVDRLIEEGAAVNVRFGQSRDSALHYFKDVEIIEKLLDCGADVNASNFYQETPLMHAVSYYKDVAIVKALVRGGAWTHVRKRGETVVSMALGATCLPRNGMPEKTLKALLEFGCHLQVDDLCYADGTSKLIIKLSMISNNIIMVGRAIQDSKYVAYAEACQSEVRLMNSKHYNGSSSLLNVVKNWQNWLPDLSIMKLLENYEETYHIYADVIFDRIHAVILDRRKLLCQLDVLVVSAEKCDGEQFENSQVILNMDCKRHIMKYVSNKDLKSFLSGVSTKTECTDDSQPNAKRAKIE